MKIKDIDPNDCPAVESGENEEDYVDRCAEEMAQDTEASEDELIAACEDAYQLFGQEEESYKEFADTGYRPGGRKRYPLDTPDLVRSSWYHLHVGNATKHYTPAQLQRIQSRISIAWQSKINKEGPPKDLALIRLLKPQRAQLDAPIMHKTHATPASGMEFVFSDATPDRFGDVIEPAGWDITNFSKNPIALFNHNSFFPIGKWKDIKISGQDLRGTLVLAPKGTSDRIDEIRKLIEADILRAVSVGFRPIKYEPIQGDTLGMRYMAHELVETSLVAVPANPNALAVAKSLNISPTTVRLVFGEHADNDTMVRRDFPAVRGEPADKSDKQRVLKTGEHAVPKPGDSRGKPMLLSKRVQDAEKSLLTLQDQLDKHLDTIDDENPTEEQMVITEDLTARIEGKQRHLNSLKAIETKNAAAATDLDSSGVPARKGNGADDLRIPHEFQVMVKRHKKDIAPIDYMIRAALVRCKSKADGLTIDDMRQKIYGNDEATRVICDLVLKAAAAPAMTTVTGWAAELVQTIFADFMDVLQPMSVFPKLSARGLALNFGRAGRISIPTRSITPSIAGSFVGEGAPIPVRQGAFTAQVLTPKKMAVITTWTREMDDHSIPAIEGLLRQAVLEDTAIALDTVLLDSNPATVIRPPGLRSYNAGLTAAVTADIFANLVSDLKQLYGALITATRGNVRAPVWILNPAQTMHIRLLQPASAVTTLFPFEAEINAGRLAGIPYIESATQPVNQVILVDAADFISAGAEGPRLEISDQATLHMEDTSPADITGGTPSPATPVKSMWQTDSLALRMIMKMNWLLRRPIVTWMTGVTW